MSTPFSVGIPENDHDFFSLTDILNSFDTPSIQRQPQLKRKRVAIEDPADDPTYAPSYAQPNIDLFSTNDAAEFFSKNQEPQTAEDFMKHFILSPSMAMEEEEKQQSSPSDGVPPEIIQRIENISQQVDLIEVENNHIFHEQKHLHVPPPKEEYTQLNHKQERLIAQCKSIQKEIQTIISSCILAPVYLYKLQSFEQLIHRYSTCLQLYQEELHYMASPAAQDPTKKGRCFATLLVIKQPFPKAVKIKAKANNHSEDPVHVQLIKAPKADCRCVGPVRAHILPEEYQPDRKSVV